MLCVVSRTVEESFKTPICDQVHTLPSKSGEDRGAHQKTPNSEERMEGRIWWPRTMQVSTLRLLSNLKSSPAKHKGPNLETIECLSCSQRLSAGSACARAYTYTYIRFCLCPGIGTARVHSFQFCRSSRWIIAAPKCLICSPGHGQISEPTNLIELSIPAGKGYRVAAHTAQAE